MTYHDADREDEPWRLLATFLREQRCRIDPLATTLGGRPRHVEAIGSPLTGREVAAAAGINARWYDLAEHGEPTRASGAILRALAEVFGLNAEQRAILVRLASPYCDRNTPRAASLELRDAYASLREYLRKLNACSTTDEVLTLVEDTAASHFPQASYVTTGLRLPDGGWVYHGEATGMPSRLRAFARNVEDVLAPIFASDRIAADIITCFPDAALPGTLITYEDYDEATLASILGEAYGDFKQLHAPMLAAAVRSRAGFVANLYLGEFRKNYESDVDRALVAAIADFASLASQ
jgi:transcriptional regulator with XRE-family HTH domain